MSEKDIKKKKQNYVNAWSQIEHDIRKHITPPNLYIQILKEKEEQKKEELASYSAGTKRKLLLIAALNREMENLLTTYELLFSKEGKTALFSVYQEYKQAFSLFEREAEKFIKKPSSESQIPHVSDNLLVKAQAITELVEILLGIKSTYQAGTVSDMTRAKKALGL